MLTITIDGLDELVARMDEVEAMDVLRPPMERSLLRLQRDLAEYPAPPAQGAWARSTPPHVKRGFFAALRAGRTSGSRTGSLGRSWTTQIRGGAGSIEGEVGNTRFYGKWVQGQVSQVPWMSHWDNTDERVLRDNEQQIRNDFAQAIAEALR